MALTKQKKLDIVAEVAALITESKMTVIAAYPHTTVKAMQQLRREARANGTKIRVVKNRLVVKAISQIDTFKNTDTSSLTGQLVYAFNGDDEVAAAQVIARFAKTNPSLEFVGAINSNGEFFGADEVKALAQLPSKNELIAQVVVALSSPLDQVINGLSGNLHALLDGVSLKAIA